MVLIHWNRRFPTKALTAHLDFQVMADKKQNLIQILATTVQKHGVLYFETKTAKQKLPQELTNSF